MESGGEAKRDDMSLFAPFVDGKNLRLLRYPAILGIIQSLLSRYHGVSIRSSGSRSRGPNHFRVSPGEGNV